MNASEQGDEPLGEAPEITTPEVRALRAAAATIEVETRQLNSVRETIRRVCGLHQHMRCGLREFCSHCQTTYPCETMRIIEAMPL